MILRLGMLAVLCATGAVAQEVQYRFVWEGAGGYVLRGALSYDPLRVDGPLVTAQDLSCFHIAGEKDGDPVGQWGLQQLNEETWWKLYLDPATDQFLVEGMGIDMPQAWNMDGYGTSCGAGGFGFNIGSAAQDLCIDGQLIEESQIDPYRPFPVERAEGVTFPAGACFAPALMSALR